MCVGRHGGVCVLFRGGGRPGRWFSPDRRYAEFFGGDIEVKVVVIVAPLFADSVLMGRYLEEYPRTGDGEYSEVFLEAVRRGGFDAIVQFDYFGSCEAQGVLLL
jgi:hypothetical protein